MNFSRVATLEEMVGHIYGRCSLVSDPHRPHMFLREIALYLDHLGAELAKHHIGLASSTPSFLREYVENLRQGIDYYHGLLNDLGDGQQDRFRSGLEAMRAEVDRLQPLVAALAD